MFSEPPGSYEICEICRWEDDDIQLQDPSYSGGANKVSLIEGQENFKNTGVSAPLSKGSVRLPNDADVRDQKWYPIHSISEMSYSDHIYYWDNGSEDITI